MTRVDIVQTLDAMRGQRAVEDALRGADDGELFLERGASESLTWEDGRLRQATRATGRGFGLRAITGEATAYAHSDLLTEASLARAVSAVVSARRAGSTARLASAPRACAHRLYEDADPAEAQGFDDRVRALEAIDTYARETDRRVRQVAATIATSRREVCVARPDAPPAIDIRPLTRVGVRVVMENQQGRRESGFAGMGGRGAPSQWLNQEAWQAMTRDALRQAAVNLEAVESPAGEMDVALAPGWPGILLHEAVGHSLEGDVNRKGTSVFAGRVGERVAAKGVHVIDDGTLPGRRGSLNIDDEGAPTERTTLIEDGILRGYIHDRMSARLMGLAPTGNGRRESWAHVPMPRMTNTFMLPGKEDPEAIIAAIHDGIYAVSFSGGQVDTTSGRFVFSSAEAYRVRNGKIQEPVRGATLIGDGASALQRVAMIGSDMSLDKGIGVCGKDGQSVPVGVGQPSLLIRGLTVGGTQS